MPDFQNVVINQPGTTKQITVPVVNVSFQVTDSTTGQVLHDFTGANAKEMWAYLGTLSLANRNEVIRVMVNTCMQIAAAGG